MARTWFFQANPKLCDIDAALGAIDEIWWRVPQYTSDIHRGDVVLLWRSGKEAGIVGVGRIAGEPRQHSTSDVEQPFVQDPEVAGVETRAPVRVRSTPFVSKDEVRLLEGFEEHAIIKAPMGTVLPITTDEYEALSPLVAPPPEFAASGNLPDIPEPFAWDQRSKSAHPMPGGYDAYLGSLRTLIGRANEERPTRTEFSDLIAGEFGVSENRSNLLAGFLRKAGMIVDSGEIVGSSEWVDRWLETGDDRLIVALLHSRVRFIGEMLQSVFTPLTTSELLDVANEQYGCGWSTKAQIDRRRGWLQSAGMLEIDESNRLVATTLGRSTVSELVLFVPSAAPSLPAQVVSDERVQEAEVAGAVLPELTSKPGSVLVDEMRGASIDSGDPDRFERAVRDVFAWLGYRAEWLGGSGKTDVLLDAPLGLGRSYRVIIDCKTSASGTVGDSQVDWITLAEHRKKHDADHVAVVAPAPSGNRLFERAREQGVTIISVDELATLCEQHGKAPLGLESYHTLFQEGGVVSTDATAEHAEDWLHVVELARVMIDTIALRSEKFGPLTAEGLQLLLADDPAAESATRGDFQEVLNTLAGPLIAVLTGTPSEGYLLTTPAMVARHRLSVLGSSLFED